MGGRERSCSSPTVSAAVAMVPGGGFQEACLERQKDKATSGGLQEFLAAVLRAQGQFP